MNRTGGYRLTGMEYKCIICECGIRPGTNVLHLWARGKKSMICEACDKFIKTADSVTHYQ